MATKSTSKKTAKKTTVSTKERTTKTQDPIMSSTVSEASKSQKSRLPLKLKKSHLIIIVVVLITAGLLYFFRSLFVAAVVNGQPITRVELVSELEKQNGKQALNSLVTKTIILQEAKKQNITVSQNEIDDEIKKIEQNLTTQGQKLEDVLALQGLTRESLVEQIRIQKIVEKMIGKDINITDEQVTKYIEENKEMLGENVKPEDVKQQLRQEQLGQKFQTWLQEKQNSANILYFVNF